MAEDVFREPHRTTRGLLALPREVRDLIYTHALVAREPIIVLDAQNHYVYPRRLVGGRNVVKDPKIRNLAGLARGLFYINRQISSESLATFYQHNTFAFMGPHRWYEPLYWIARIGNINRRSLTRMLIFVPELEKVWQRPDGSRDEFDTVYTDTVMARPRHPLLHWMEETWPEGEVEDIPPIIEELFKDLGEDGNGNRLILQLQNITPGYPGYVATSEDDTMADEDSWMSMDLPNLAEAWSRLHGNRPGRRSIDVEWLDSTSKANYEETVREQMIGVGWKIYSEGEFCYHYEADGITRHVPSMRWMMKLGDPGPRIIASRTNPWAETRTPPTWWDYVAGKRVIPCKPE
ncbi:Hypothetical protein D9617_34g040600 [Elsinoe fawcettii]|nr:Hypothetical protein D9617_34g040600 [Elsinoe fawcettii]